MAIERDDCDERQARLDQMIDEFQEARRKRLAPASGDPVESQLETEATTAASVNGYHPDETDR